MNVDFGKAIVDKIEKTKDGCILNIPNRGTFGVKVHLTTSDMVKISKMLESKGGLQKCIRQGVNGLKA